MFLKEVSSGHRGYIYFDEKYSKNSNCEILQFKLNVLF